MYQHLSRVRSAIMRLLERLPSNQPKNTNTNTNGPAELLVPILSTSSVQLLNSNYHYLQYTT